MQKCQTPINVTRFYVFCSHIYDGLLELHFGFFFKCLSHERHFCGILSKIHTFFLCTKKTMSPMKYNIDRRSWMETCWLEIKWGVNQRNVLAILENRNWLEHSSGKAQPVIRPIYLRLFITSQSDGKDINFWFVITNAVFDNPSRIPRSPQYMPRIGT